MLSLIQIITGEHSIQTKINAPQVSKRTPFINTRIYQTIMVHAIAGKSQESPIFNTTAYRTGSHFKTVGGDAKWGTRISTP